MPSTSALAPKFLPTCMVYLPVFAIKNYTVHVGKYTVQYTFLPWIIHWSYEKWLDF